MHLPNLPLNAFVNVFTFLDEKSLLAMRKVCSPVKEMVDSSILNIKNTKVGCVQIGNSVHWEEETSVVRPEEWSITFAFYQERDYHMWKIAMENALSKKEMKLKDSYLQFYEGMGMTVEVRKTEDVRAFFELLKPYCTRAEYDILELHDLPEMIQTCLDFFETKKIPRLFMPYSFRESKGITPLFLDLVKRIRPDDVYRPLNRLNKDSIPYLQQLADMVKSIKIMFEERGDATPSPDLLPITRNMLSRKCVTLELRDHENDIASIKFSDVNRLIQHFHHSGKRVTFRAEIDMPRFYTIIGKYQVNVFPERFQGRNNHLEIKHLGV